MSKLLIKNGILVGLEPLKLEKLDLLIEDGRVVQRDERIRGDRGTKVLDCRGRFILPGFVNAHCRLYSSQMTGMPLPAGVPDAFRERREQVWWRAEDSLEPETVVTSAFAGALDAVRLGTTTVIDMHASPSCVKESLELVRDSVLTVGLRCVLSYEVSDRHGDEVRDAALAENRRFIRAHHSDKVVGACGAQAPFALSDETLAQLGAIKDEAAGSFHITLGQDATDREEALARFGMSPTAKLDELGLLGNRSVLAHGVHLDADDLKLIQERGAWIVHCPTSDMLSGVGHAAIDRMGELVALGTNGRPSDMFTEARTALAVSRSRGVPLTPEDIVKMIAGGQALASELLGIELGSTRRDAGADFVVLAYHPRTPINADNLASHLVLAMGPQHIESVVIDGRVAFENGRYPEVDTGRLAPLMRKGAQQLWTAMESG